MADKSYNSRALAGEQDYDDTQFQADMKRRGINIPDDALYSPKLNAVALGQMRDKVMKEAPGMNNPLTGMKFTPEEAKKMADDNYNKGMDKFSSLSGVDLRKLDK